MKKIILTLLVVGLALGFYASNVFAATGDCSSSFTACTQITDPNGGVSRNISVKLSPNVTLAYLGASDNYALATYNTHGNLGYAASSTFQGIEVTKNDIASTSDSNLSFPSSASSTFDSSNWTVLGK